MLIRACTFLRLLDRLAILATTRLAAFCGQDERRCRVYLNGYSMQGTLAKPVRNGDYIRITVKDDLDPETQSIVTTEFGVIDHAPGWEYLEERAVETLASSSSQMTTAVRVLPRPSTALVGSSTLFWQEWYWIVLALYLHVAVPVLFWWTSTTPSTCKTCTGTSRLRRGPHGCEALVLAYLLLTGSTAGALCCTTLFK